MKRLIFSCTLLLSVCQLFAQSNNLNTFNALSARVLAIDHNTPNEELSDLSLTYALEVGYRRQIFKNLGLVIPVKVGVIDVGQLDNITVAGIDALLQYYPLGVDAKVTPYLHSGIGVMTERFEDTNRQIPFGLGLNFRLDNNSWFNVQGEYRSSNQENRDNIMAGLGYVYRFSSIDTDGDGIVNRDDPCPTEPGPAATNGCPDGDMDGIVDAEDECPTVAGLAAFGGCPDTDGDGVPDAGDKCPDAPGPAELEGCPDTDGDGISDLTDKCPDAPGTREQMGCPDTDGDGVADNEDKCPDLAGDPRLGGCPDTDGDGITDDMDRCPKEAGKAPSGCPDRDGDGFPDGEDECPDQAGNFKGCPDSDGDGVADNTDRCPTQAGPKENGGCPEIKKEVKERLAYAARAVQFESGSDRLKESSYVILSEVAGIMRQYPDYDLTISGHTDNVGSDATNLSLSERRAAACREFIIATGISYSRISSTGYGENRPTADNATSAGRRLNRRVEFELSPRR